MAQPDAGTNIDQPGVLRVFESKSQTSTFTTRSPKYTTCWRNTVKGRCGRPAWRCWMPAPARKCWRSASERPSSGGAGPGGRADRQGLWNRSVRGDAQARSRKPKQAGPGRARRANQRRCDLVALCSGYVRRHFHEFHLGNFSTRRRFPKSWPNANVCCGQVVESWWSACPRKETTASSCTFMNGRISIFPISSIAGRSSCGRPWRRPGFRFRPGKRNRCGCLSKSCAG